MIAYRPSTVTWIAVAVLVHAAAPLQAAPILGAAGDFALLMADVSPGSFNFNEGEIQGDAGVSGGATVNFNGTHVVGAAYVDAVSQFIINGDGAVTGGVSSNPTLLDLAAGDASAAAAVAASMTATQAAFGSINAPTDIFSTTAVNVVHINGDVSSGITLHGDADTVYVVNVSGSNINFGAGTGIFLDGVTADHVLFNFTNTNTSLNFSSNSEINGTMLSIHNASSNFDGTVNGALLLIGGNVALNNGTINHIPFVPTPIPEPSTLLLLGLSGSLAAVCLARRSRRAGSLASVS